jgi:RNA polymerase primary sigma factor
MECDMHRSAAKMKTNRKNRPPRNAAGRRPKVERQVAKPAAPAFVRPANDTGVDMADMDLRDPVVTELTANVTPDLDAVAESLAVEPEIADDSIPEELVAAGAGLVEAEPSEELPEVLDEEEDGEEELSAEAEPEAEAEVDEEGAAASSGKSEEPQSFLAMYFRDMAELSVLKPEQEFETARQIEEMELDLWQSLLGYAPWAGHLVRVVETAMGGNLPDFKTYQALSEKVARKASPTDKRKLSKLFASLASQIKEQDIDRVFVDAALTELQRLAGAAAVRRPIEGIGFNTESKAFQEFASAIARKSGVVKRAKNEFVKANLRLVVSIARRFNHGRLPLPDLIQEGNIGLMKAVERYDYRRGFRFSTYASWWIRHAISRALADKGRAVRLPVHMIDAYHRIAKSERELQSKLERPATTEEIASVTGIEAEKLEKMRTFLADNPVSLDRSLSEDDGRRLIDVLVDPNEAPSPPEQMVSSETQQEMLKLLSVLKPIEADILRKRFGLINDHERTLKEIGDEYRLSRERVRQLQEQALGKMRKAMAKREIL